MNRSVSCISCIRPHLKWINQARYCRPTVKIAKDKFELTIDVRDFSEDEIKIQARPETVVVEGKQERKYKNGHVIRQFVRRFKLPEGCNPNKIESRLSNRGVLTIIAHRCTPDGKSPSDRRLPVNFNGPGRLDTACMQSDDYCNQPCCPKYPWPQCSEQNPCSQDPCEITIPIKTDPSQLEAPLETKTDLGPKPQK